MIQNMEPEVLFYAPMCLCGCFLSNTFLYLSNVPSGFSLYSKRPNMIQNVAIQKPATRTFSYDPMHLCVYVVTFS